ncbi:MAG: hypothetical protein ABIJ45_09400 [Candidatus Zixiibacteriota bacterium]
MKKLQINLIILTIIFGLSGFCPAGDNQFPSEEQINRANETLRQSLIKSEIPIKEIASNLMYQKYEELEKIYEEIFYQYRADVTYEARLWWAYDIFNPKSGLPIGELNRWVETTGSYIAYTARGFYYTNLAYAVRGQEYVANTPAEHLDEMHQYLAKAIPDLKKAIELNPKNMPAYAAMIQAAMSEPSVDAEKYLETALKNDERSYYVRSQYMLKLQPRWGGSYEAMEQFGDETAAKADLNPRFWTFKGAVAADKASLAYDEGDMKTAAKFYNYAMKFGERVQWLQYRAACYYKSGQLEEAHRDFVRMLYYDGENELAKEWSQYLSAKIAFDKMQTAGNDREEVSQESGR